MKKSKEVIKFQNGSEIRLSDALETSYRGTMDPPIWPQQNKLDLWVERIAQVLTAMLIILIIGSSLWWFFN